MAQKRRFEFKDDDKTIYWNQHHLGIFEPGIYRGFDAVFQTGLNLRLSHTTSGAVYIDENELETSPLGFVITKQGVVITEDNDIVLSVEPGGTNPRWDAVILEHYYEEVTGGTPGIYQIIKGTPSVTPDKPDLTNPTRQLVIGYLYVPANMSSLTETGVLFEKEDIPDYAKNGFLQRIRDIEEVQAQHTTDIADRLRKSLNGTDIPNKATFRNSLQLGNHVTHNYAGSGGNYGTSSTVARGNHAHSGVYEPVFSKNSAFNKNFGTTSGTVTQGNDSRLSNSRRCNNTFDSASSSRSALGLGNHVTYNFSGSGSDHGTSNSIARGDHRHPASDITSGTFATARIPNLSYSKITSGNAYLYGYMHTRGYRITYGGSYGGIYMRSDGNISMGASSGSANRFLYVYGNLEVRNTDIMNAAAADGASMIRGRGQYGSYPHVLWISVSPTGTISKAVGINVQQDTWNDTAGKYEWYRMMNKYGGVDGYIGNAGGGTRGIEIWGLNDTHAPSDRRLKDEITKTQKGIKTLMPVNIVDFKYKSNMNELRTGIIAQELEELLPDFVDNPEERNKERKLNAGSDAYEYMSVKYQRFIPVLIKAVQELQDQINELKKTN